MHPFDREADDPRAILGAEQANAVQRRQGLASLAHQSALMGADRFKADLLDIIDGGLQPQHPDDMGRSGLEPGRRRGEGRSSEAYLVDHCPAPLPGRHRLEQLGPAPQHSDPGRAVELVAGENVEVAAERGDVDRHSRHRLAAVEKEQCADGVGEVRGAAGVEH